MELKQVFFEKRTRISGSAQRLSNYTFAVLFALISPIMLIMSLTEGKFKMELFLMGIGVLLVLLGLAYLAYRAALKLKRVEADEEKIYIIHNKTDVEEVLYAQVT
ncbi:MAG: hypothetical protein U9R19_06195, partial [Bacteroidota bacterium]|nr:hypothetical protein [Bacteroidota bacterium]